MPTDSRFDEREFVSDPASPERVSDENGSSKSLGDSVFRQEAAGFVRLEPPETGVNFPSHSPTDLQDGSKRHAGFGLKDSGDATVRTSARSW